MDVHRIRKDFPVLRKGIIYFDNAATSLTPIQVINKMNEYYMEYRANVHRGLHKLSMKATEEFEKARKIVADFLNSSFEEIIFTYNTSYAINIVSENIELKKHDKILIQPFEHHSNLLPWIKLKKKKKIKLEYINILKDEENYGIIDLSDIESKIKEAKILAIQHVSNVTGAIQPLREISKLCEEYGVILVVDAAQSAGHLEIDVKKIRPSFLAFSGHKGTLGPTGIGVLYISKEMHENFEGFVGGGTPRDVDMYDYKLTSPPEKYEAGTPNVSGAIGLAEGIKYIENVGIKNIEKHEKKLVKHTIYEFEEMGIEYYGPKDINNRVGLVSFNVNKYHPHEIAAILDINNICVRSGHHCVLLFHKDKKIDGSIRASYHLYNTIDEINKMIDTLYKLLGR